MNDKIQEDPSALPQDDDRFARMTMLRWYDDRFNQNADRFFQDDDMENTRFRPEPS